MRKLLLGLAAAALFAPAGRADDTPPFSVTPGFVVTPPAAKADKCACTACACEPGDCPGRCGTAAAVAANPMWFALKVQVGLSGGRHGIGSGTPIYSGEGKTLVLTNAHVATQDCTSFTVVVPTGKTYAARRLDGSNVRHKTPTEIVIDGVDLAILEVEGELGAVQIAASAPAVNEQVWQFGYGGGVGPTVRTGYVMSSPFSEPTLCSSIPCIQGDSGSGVFNVRGELVGVTHGGTADGRIPHMAVPMAAVRAFAAKPLLARLFPRLSDRLAARAAAREAASAAGAAAREGKVDPLNPAAPPAAPAPKAASPAAPQASAPAAPSDPFGLAAQGWTYRGNGVWTRSGGVSGAPAGSACANGQCPAPAFSGRTRR